MKMTKMESWEKSNFTMRKRPRIMVRQELQDLRQMRTRRNLTRMAKVELIRKVKVYQENIL